MREFLSFYLTDVFKFDTFIDTTLDSLLWNYTKCGQEKTLYLPCATISSSSALAYLAIPDSGVFVQTADGIPQPIQQHSLNNDTVLSLKTRDYLSQMESSELKEIIDCFSSCSNVDFIKALIVEERWWWIGSLLDGIQRLEGAEGDNSVKIATLFQRVLRGYDCGISLHKRAYNLSDINFPVIPSSESEVKMAAWTEEETAFIATYLDALSPVRLPQLNAPSLEGYLPPMTDVEWAEWVYDAVKQLAQITQLSFEHAVVVSFIE
jgi:hypothetical protein